MNKIAIMGGTFDPIHYGHLSAAEAVRKAFHIDQVLFIPTGKPPHKKGSDVSSKEHRFSMTLLATTGNPNFLVSRNEIDRSGFTYTIDTVEEILKIYPENTKLYFIVGADTIHQMVTWKHIEKLVRLCEFIAVTRPDYNEDTLLEEMESIRKTYKMKLHFLDIPALSVSSSQIRERMASGQSVRYLLPETVVEYLYKYDLYTESHPDKRPWHRKQIKQQVKSTLSPTRFAHTLGVAETACKLARVYLVEENKAYLAALLHDYAKNFSDEQLLKMCKKFKIVSDEVTKKQIDLLHGAVAAKMAEEEFNILDEDILNAIRYHTTGRQGMSVLEKIIYLADCIEPTRPNYAKLSDIKCAAYENLDRAMIIALQSKIDYNHSKNRIFHPASLEALDDLIRQN